MKYVLEIRDGVEDNSPCEETEFSSNELERAQKAFRRAMLDMIGKISKVILWREFDSMEDAPIKSGYRIVEKRGKRVLRSCQAAC